MFPEHQPPYRHFALTLLLHFLLVLREEKKMGSQCELDFTAEPG